jgi:hypothetical protein
MNLIKVGTSNQRLIAIILHLITLITEAHLDHRKLKRCTLFGREYSIVCAHMCVCVCVCVCARARVCVSQTSNQLLLGLLTLTAVIMQEHATVYLNWNIMTFTMNLLPP